MSAFQCGFFCCCWGWEAVESLCSVCVRACEGPRETSAPSERTGAAAGHRRSTALTWSPFRCSAHAPILSQFHADWLQNKILRLFSGWVNNASPHGKPAWPKSSHINSSVMRHIKIFSFSAIFRPAAFLHSWDVFPFSASLLIWASLLLIWQSKDYTQNIKVTCDLTLKD